MGFRTGLVVASVFLLSGTASAQEGLRSASLPARTPQNPIPEGSQPGLRSGSLPDRNPTTMPIPPDRVDQFIAHPRTFTPRLPGEPPRRRGRFQNYLFGGYNYGYGYGDVYATRESATEPVPSGYLYLDLRPGTAQVYVDGLYMGTVDDFRRLIPGRAMDAGAHRLELRASGYESASFNVLIQPGETTTYRADLQQTAPRQQAAAAPPKTFYVIPGCYAGDKRPSAQSLRKGCDIAKVRVIPPAVNALARDQR
jgi:hypothetical protein